MKTGRGQFFRVMESVCGGWVGGCPRLWVGLSFVTLGEVPQVLGPQFPLL